jgi:signal transduction histidine kinase
MLICENKGYTDVSLELGRVDRFVEQALFYARSKSVEKDYVIKQISLKQLIGELLKKNASLLIAKKIKVELNADGEVHSDSKWLMFILQQLLDNSIKYRAKTISFSFAGQTLTVKDDGVGIPAQDLPSIFERGFTGENGRIVARSTGMGLYLCRELCSKLGLTISAASQKGAEFYIVFPKNSYVTFL